MEHERILHLLRNPWGHRSDDLDKARHAAADALEKWHRCVTHPASAVEWIAVMQAELSALRAHRDELTDELGSLEDRMQELRARVASEYRKGHAAGQEAAMESAAALRTEVNAFREDAANYYRVAKEADAQQATLRARVADLSMLVRRLSRHAPPGLAGDAMDYLKRHGLEGSPLRDAGNKEGSRNG